MCETGVVWDNISVMRCGQILQFTGSSRVLIPWKNIAVLLNLLYRRAGEKAGIFLFPSLECEIAFSSTISSKAPNLQPTPVAVQQLRSGIWSGGGGKSGVGQQGWGGNAAPRERLPAAVRRPCWYLGFGMDIRRGCILGKKLKRQEGGKAC